jgi:hypothetical protein
MTGCLRCPPDTNQLEDCGHPLCARCARSLRYEEAGACAQCIDRLLGNLTDLIGAYEQLPDAAQQVGGTRHVPPGGNLLVLAGPGSEGRTGLTGVRLPTGAIDDTHGLDEHATDPPSVAWELGSLEDDWRRHLGHPAAVPPGHVQKWDGFHWHPPLVLPATPARPRKYLSAVVRNAIRYLQQHAEWCANTYPDGFVEAADTAWRLRQRVWGALGLLEPRQVPARCIPCGAAGVDARLEDMEGVWWCPRCGGTIGPAAYVEALRAGLEQRNAG